MIGSSVVRWLLGLESVAADAADVRLAWERPVPTWIMACLLAAAAAVAWAAYRRMDVSPRRRTVMAVLRWSGIALLLALLAGPVLEVPRESIDPDAVIVLADRSRSMEVEDMPADAGALRSRDAALREIAGPGTPFAAAGDEHRVVWQGFADGLVPLAPEGAGVRLGSADGDRTSLARAIEESLARNAGRPVSCIVLMTDGRTIDPPSRALVRRLQAEGIAVSAVALGASAAMGDAAVVSSEAPRRAFARDLVPVEATIERRGPARGRALRVELVDRATGTVLDRAELPALGDGDGTARDQVQLVATPPAAGDLRWEVRVGTSDASRDLISANDRREVPVTIVDRPLRVLYIDGYPRWEYRYLKNLLQRERSVESAVMLLSADRDFAQEGNTPIARLPRTREEFDRFDLFVLGDLPSSFFTGEQLAEIRRAVGDRGAGLAWIGGSRSTPRTWPGTALEELLPFAGPFELDRLPEPVNMEPTALAARLGVLRLADDPKGPFPAELREQPWAQLEWAQRIAQSALKPAAEVLAQGVQRSGGEQSPLVVSMRYGAGTVLYVATDEVWRWRNGRGETYPERFWVQLLRSLARPSLGTGREEVRIAAEPGRATMGDTVRVEVELPAGMPPSTVALEAIPEDGSRATAEFEAAPSQGGLLVAQWQPAHEGRWRIRPRDPALASRAGDGASIEIVRSDRELRDAEADRALLEQLARETGGRVVGPEGLPSLVASLPNRSIRTENPIRDPIWNSPLALLLLVAIFGSEWAMRRTARLA